MRRSKNPVVTASPVATPARPPNWSRLARHLSRATAGSRRPWVTAGWRRPRVAAAAGAVLVAVPLAIVAVAGPAAQARPGGSLARAAHEGGASTSQTRSGDAGTGLVPA